MAATADALLTASSFSVTRARIVLGLLFGSAVVLPSLYKSLLESTWAFLITSPFYNWSTFETIWTVICYAAIEVPMTVVFIKHPSWRFSATIQQQGYQKLEETSSPISKETKRRKPRGMRRPSRRLLEAITYVAPLLLLDLTMIKKFAGVPLEAKLLSGNYDPSIAASSAVHGPHNTFLVPTLHNFTLSSPLQTQRALPVAAPSSRRLVLELLISLFLYDTLFFLFHLSLHTVPLLRHFHATHHAHDAQLNPQVTNQLHVVERLGLVLLANFALNIIGSHVLTRTLFVPVFVWLLVELHSGMDLPWGYDKILPRGWAGGARKHMQHHRTGEGGLEPYFNLWDGLLVRWTRQSSKDPATGY